MRGSVLRAAIVKQLLARLRTPTMFALLFQGINGLIQVSAYFGLRGAPYLGFSDAFLKGSVLAMLCAFNLENQLLGGVASASVRRYFLGFWGVGVGAAVAAILMRQVAPSFVAFCCWVVCFRLFLAWATHLRPLLTSLLLAGAVALVMCLFGSPVHVLLAGMLAFPLAAWRAIGPPWVADDGVLALVRHSASAFARYLPHTISGLVVGYADRYVALHVVRGEAAETYLRTVQVCAWAAFLAYPVVYQARSRLLRVGVLGAGRAGLVIAMLMFTLAGALAAILLFSRYAGRALVLQPWVVMLVFLGTVFSLCYQIVSSLNFVRQRFATINRITLTSAAVSLSCAFLLVPWQRSSTSLALVLFAGWSVQALLTVLTLPRRAAGVLVDVPDADRAQPRSIR